MSERVPFSSPMELEDGKARWNLESDLRLLGLLKNTSDNFVHKVKSKLTTFNEIEKKSDTCSNQVDNLITKVLILTNTRFIENRVYEEDISDITTTATSSVAPLKPRTNEEQREKIIVDKLKTSIDVGVDCLRSKFFTSSQPQEYDQSNVLVSIYLAGNKFANHPLPYLLGSEEYAKDVFVGLKKEESGEPIIMINENRISQPSHLTNNNNSVSIDDFPGQNGSDRINAKQPRILNLVDDASDEDIFETDPQFVKPSLAANREVQSNFFAGEDEFGSQEGGIDNLFDSQQEQGDELSNQVPHQTPRAFPQVPSQSKTLVNEINERLKSAKTISNRLFDESDDDQDDLFSAPSMITTISRNVELSKENKQVDKPEQPTTTAKSSTKTLHSIFGSDSEDETVDIFKHTLPSSQNQSKIAKQATVRSSSMFSSSSSEEDIFSPKEISSKPKQTLPSILVAPSSEKSSSQPKKSLLAQQPGMSSLMNELASKLNASSNPSNDGKNVKKTIGEAPKDEEKVFEKSRESENDLLGETNRGVKDNSFNDMLKHKASLNVSRRRKAPSRYSTGSRFSFPPTNEAKDDADFTDAESQDLFAAKPEESLPSVKSSSPAIPNPVLHSTPRSENVKSNDILNESDEEDLFASSLARTNWNITNKKTISSETPALNNATQKTSIPKKKVASLFSSDDSDEDVFASATSKARRPVSNASIPSTKVTVSATSSVTSAKPKISQSNKKKSLFDSDSDDDQLFG